MTPPERSSPSKRNSPLAPRRPFAPGKRRPRGVQRQGGDPPSRTRADPELRAIPLLLHTLRRPVREDMVHQPPSRLVGGPQAKGSPEPCPPDLEDQSPETLVGEGGRDSLDP